MKIINGVKFTNLVDTKEKEQSIKTTYPKDESTDKPYDLAFKLLQ